MRRARPRVRLLVVEDDPGDAALVRQMLLEAPGSPFAVEWVDHLGAARKRLAAGGIDAVLADLGLPDSAGLPTFEKLQRAAPGVPVIVLSGNEDESFALKAVREGVEDYLVKGQVTAEALARCVRYALERRRRRAMGEQAPPEHRRSRGRVLGFLGAKGGVGTTTVALNVAAALAGAGHDVLLAEFRGHYGTLSSHFGRERPPANLSSLLGLEPARISPLELQARLFRHSSSLRILFGPQRAAEARPIPGELAAGLVNRLAHMARFLVLDLPAEPTEATREAVRAGDFLGLVLDREAGCLAGAEVMLDQVRAWGSEALIGGVIVHRTPLACPLDLERIAQRLRHGIAALIPPAADACVLAQAAGLAVVDSHPDSLIADSFRRLAAMLAEEPIVIRKTA